MNIKSYETVTIETERLLLKKGTIEDFVSVFEYNMMKLRDIAGEFEYEKQDPEKIHGWFGSDVDTYYQKCASDYKCLDWVIYLRSTMEPIGNITSDRERPDMNACELAYNLHPHYWGRGYMPEAVAGVLNHLFEIGYDNVISGWEDANHKSKSVSDKLGFELFNVIENYRLQKGTPITAYETVMNKEKWNDISKNKTR